MNSERVNCLILNQVKASLGSLQKYCFATENNWLTLANFMLLGSSETSCYVLSFFFSFWLLNFFMKVETDKIHGADCH